MKDTLASYRDASAPPAIPRPRHPQSQPQHHPPTRSHPLNHLPPPPRQQQPPPPIRSSTTPTPATSTAAVPPSPTPSPSPSRPTSPSSHGRTPSSSLHPRLAVILGVDRRWYIPLVVCRALSTVPAAWWGLRCAFTFLGELLRLSRAGGAQIWEGGWEEAARVAAEVGGEVGEWDVERRFRVTEVALAIMWCSASAYLSYFFADCMMSRWLLNYSPPAVVIRLLTTNALIAYITSWVLYFSGASSDPRLLLPAWISITTTLTFLYHITQRQINIKKETSASISVFSIASFISMSSLLLQLHLTRENEPEVPAFVLGRRVWEVVGRGLAELEVRPPQVRGEL
ncbi:hypothetical protein FQN54_004476 [Arachnomyces sp. PD_36]|nr:hypothetical protein FQN54_004476 [Arachnomyces sp. PD_36]